MILSFPVFISYSTLLYAMLEQSTCVRRSSSQIHCGRILNCGELMLAENEIKNPFHTDTSVNGYYYCSRKEVSEVLLFFPYQRSHSHNPRR